MTKISTFSIDTIVVASGEQVSTEISGEAVILHLESGLYFGLNPVGSRIWQLIQKPIAIRDVRDAILNEYQVEQDRADRDLFSLLDSLATHQLIEIEDNGSGGQVAAADQIDG